MDKEKALESLKLAQESIENIYEILDGEITEDIGKNLNQAYDCLDQVTWLVKDFKKEPEEFDPWTMADRKYEAKVNEF